MSHVTRPTRRRAALMAALALVAAPALAACGGSDDGASDDSSDSAEPTTLTVFAAASLDDTFTELGTTFEAEHDGVTVRFSFGGSSDLAEQIRSGAPADVFAAADTPTMEKLGSEVDDSSDFATNTLEIAVPKDNPAGIRSFADLAKAGTKLVVCAPEVPCGRATQTAAQAADVTLDPVSEEQSVTDVLGKVSSGEADAGLVYKTDVEAAGDDVQGITFDEASSAVNVYPIAQVAASENARLAREFIDLVTGAEGQKVLREAGFAKP